MSKISNERLAHLAKECADAEGVSIGGWRFKSDYLSFSDMGAILTELQSLRSQPAGVRGDAASSLMRITAIVEGLYGFLNLGPNSPEELKENWAKWCKEKERAWGIALEPQQEEAVAWRSMDDAPRNASEVLLRVPATATRQPYVVVGHWACDMSGEEQPPFRGWFTNAGHGFAQMSPEPSHWAPLYLYAHPTPVQKVQESQTVSEDNAPILMRLISLAEGVMGYADLSVPEAQVAWTRWRDVKAQALRQTTAALETSHVTG